MCLWHPWHRRFIVGHATWFVRHVTESKVKQTAAIPVYKGCQRRKRGWWWRLSTLDTLLGIMCFSWCWMSCVRTGSQLKKVGKTREVSHNQPRCVFPLTLAERILGAWGWCLFELWTSKKVSVHSHIPKQKHRVIEHLQNFDSGLDF